MVVAAFAYVLSQKQPALSLSNRRPHLKRGLMLLTFYSLPQVKPQCPIFHFSIQSFTLPMDTQYITAFIICYITFLVHQIFAATIIQHHFFVEIFFPLINYWLEYVLRSCSPQKRRRTKKKNKVIVPLLVLIVLKLGSDLKLLIK